MIHKRRLWLDILVMQHYKHALFILICYCRRRQDEGFLHRSNAVCYNECNANNFIPVCVMFCKLFR